MESKYRMLAYVVLGGAGGVALFQATWWPVLAVSLVGWLTALNPGAATRHPQASSADSSFARTATSAAAYWLPLFTVAFDPVGAAFANHFAPGLFWRLVVSTLLATFTASGYVVATCLTFGPSRHWALPRVLLFGGYVWLWEWLRTEWLHWPLAKLAYGFSDSPLMNVAPLVGAYGASALAVGLAGSFAVLSARRMSVRTPLAQFVVASLAVGGVTALLLRSNEGGPRGGVDRVSVSLVPAPPSEKYDPRMLKARTEHIINFSAQAPGQLVVFPETALPLPWQLLPDSARRRLVELGQTKTLVIGSFRVEGDRSFNTAVVLAPGATVTFLDKHLLFVFAEFFPAALQWLKLLMEMPFQDLTPGPVVHQRPGPHMPSVLVCQDVASPTVSAMRARETPWVLLISDLSWFPDGRASAHELMMARWRAAETARWLLVAGVPQRATLLTPQGAVAQSAPVGAMAWHVDVPRGPANGTTPYMQVPAAFLLVIPFGHLLAVRRARRLEKQQVL